MHILYNLSTVWFKNESKFQIMVSVWNYVYFHLCTAQLRTMTRAESNVSRWGRGHRVSGIVGYWPDFQWADQQRYLDLRPVWEGTEGTDAGGLSQALSSDSQMDAVDWLSGGRSKNLSPAYHGGPHACVDKSPGESPEPASRRPGNYCFSPFGCPARGRHNDR